MKDQADISLSTQLDSLHKSHFVLGLKTGTEVEDMGFDEISYLKSICGLLPLTVKIGGPEARNDIRQCLKIGVDVILAPMVETVYALDNFVKTMEALSKESGSPLPKLAINIESKTAVKNLDEMLHSRAAQQLYQITIGRSDLSKSMHLAVDDPEVLSLTRQAVKKINHYGLLSSVGGGLTMEKIENLIHEVPANKLNTRHIVFSNSRSFQKNPVKHLFHGMMFELALYQRMMQIFKERKSFYKNRVDVIKMRMGNLTLLDPKQVKA